MKSSCRFTKTYHESDFRLIVLTLDDLHDPVSDDEAGRLQGFQAVASRGDGEDLVQEQSWPSQADYIILFISPEAPIRSKLSSSFSVLTVFKVCT